MQPLPYLNHYPEQIKTQVRRLIDTDTLGDYLLKKYPQAHDIRTDKALYAYVTELKNSHMRKSQPLSKIAYDGKINLLHDALGMHTFISRVQGGRLKAKNEIRIAAQLKTAPEPFLRMIAVHELAHLKEKEHNKAFYRLCEHMEPDYHQLELDLRLLLIQSELFSNPYA